jgi:hypothetical protein
MGLLWVWSLRFEQRNSTPQRPTLPYFGEGIEEKTAFLFKIL